MAKRSKCNLDYSLVNNMHEEEKRAPLIKDCYPELQELFLEWNILWWDYHAPSPIPQKAASFPHSRTYKPDDKAFFSFTCQGKHEVRPGVFEINDEIRNALNRRKKELEEKGLEGKRQCNGTFIPGHEVTRCNCWLQFKVTATYKPDVP